MRKSPIAKLSICATIAFWVLSCGIQTGGEPCRSEIEMAPIGRSEVFLKLSKTKGVEYAEIFLGRKLCSTPIKTGVIFLETIKAIERKIESQGRNEKNLFKGIESEVLIYKFANGEGKYFVIANF